MKVLLMTLLAVAAAPAMAAYGSSAGVRDLRYELIDLRPDDGIAPSATFLYEDALAAVIIEPGDRFHSQLTDVTTLFGAATARLEVPEGRGDAFVAYGADGLTMRTTTRAEAPPPGQSNIYLSSAWSRQHGMRAVLSPYTGIRWTGSYEVDAWADAGPIGTPWRERSQAKFFMDLITPTFARIAEATVVAYSNPRMGAHSSHDEGSFSFTYANAVDAATEVQFQAMAFADGGFHPPVPEPATSALMLAGLGVLGGVAARRRRGANRTPRA